MTKRQRLILLLWLLSLASLPADSAIRGIGHMGSSARMLGLAQIGSVGTEGIEPLFENPSQLAYGSRGMAGFMTANPYGTVTYQSFGAVLPEVFGSTLGLGMQRAWTDGIYHTIMDQNTLDVTVDDTFSYEQYSIKLAAGKALADDLALGMSLGYQSITAGSYGQGGGFTMGLGITYRYSAQVTLGGQADNLLSAFRWQSGTSEQLAYRYAAGCSIQPIEPLTLSIGTEVEQDRDAILRGAVSYRPLEILELRGGLYQQTTEGGQTGIGLTAGVGARMHDLCLDYAYRHDSEYQQNSTHFFSFAFAWGEERGAGLPPAQEEPTSAKRNVSEGEAERLAAFEQQTVKGEASVADVGRGGELRSEDASCSSDVPSEHWAAAEIGQLNRSGVMIGYPDSTFKPQQAMTKGELLAVLARLKGCEPPVLTTQEAALLPGSQWVKPYLRAAVDNGLITQEEASDPNAEVLRKQALMLLLKHIPFGQSGPAVHSSETIEAYLAEHRLPEELAGALRAHIIVGVSRDTIDLQLDRPIRRAEVARLVALAER